MGNLAIMSPGEQGTTTQYNPIGVGYADGWGRVWHYAYCATATGRGKVAVAAATIANHNSMSFATAPAVGDTKVYVTLGGTAITAEQYKDGWLTVNDGTGEGRIYRIKGNDAQATTTGTAVIYLAESIDTAGALSEANVDLSYNLYDEVIVQTSTTQTFIPVGVPNCVGGLGTSEFGWLQTYGPCAVWQDEATAALGESMTLGAGTGTGQVEGRDAVAEPIIGSSGPVTAVADEYQWIFLKLDASY